VIDAEGDGGDSNDGQVIDGVRNRNPFSNAAPSRFEAARTCAFARLLV
jgi:hypothetical protein